MDEHLPDLSVVLLTPDTYATIHRTVQHLRAQTVKDRLELVIVAPRGADLELGEVRGDFAAVQVVEGDPLRSTAEARAAGVRAAGASLVALTEDHSFPAPGWAAALIRAHRGPWAAVGPVVHNANPLTLISWANYLFEYSPWMGAGAGREVDHLPGHNSSYKRAVLLAYGERLSAMLEVESILHWDLKARGHRLYLEPGAVTHHLNYSATMSWVTLQFHASRLFAATRARWGDWPAGKRLLFALAAPLIPGLRLGRILRQLKANCSPHPVFLRLLPPLGLALLASAAGELLGCLGGERDAGERVSAMEFHRQRFLHEHDLAIWAGFRGLGLDPRRHG